MSKQINWGKLLKVLIAVLTALAGSIGLASCAKGGPQCSQAKRLDVDKSTAVATDAHHASAPKGENSGITENIMPCQYENAFTFREIRYPPPLGG
ncbi:MAG: smalltalk protein [Bacteroidaceae bacterium]|nr:smalltalk protein [Bacteroidaceae bacterium]